MNKVLLLLTTVFIFICNGTVKADTNIACNYTKDTISNTNCELVNDKYVGIVSMQLTAGYYWVDPSRDVWSGIDMDSITLKITFSDGHAVSYSRSNLGTSLVNALPICGTKQGTTSSGGGDQCSLAGFLNFLGYGRYNFLCKQSSDCFSSGLEKLVTLSGFNDSVQLIKPKNSVFSGHLIEESMGLLNCTYTGTMDGFNFSSGVNVYYTCIPVSASRLFETIRENTSMTMSLADPNSYNGRMLDTIWLSYVDIETTTPFFIGMPKGECNYVHNLGEYVFEENKSTVYSLHVPYNTDEISLRLVPKLSRSKCTHNVSNVPGASPYAQNYYAVNVNYNASCDHRNTISNITTELDDLDTTFVWKISGLKGSYGAVSCRNTVVAEVTWY